MIIWFWAQETGVHRDVGGCSHFFHPAALYNCLMYLLKTMNAVVKAKPTVQAINKALPPNKEITKPPKKLDKGIKPWLPISVKLMTLPSLSLSTIDISLVLEGMLIVTSNTPSVKQITTVEIRNELMSMMFLTNNT